MTIKVDLKGIVDIVGVLNKILDDLKISTSPRQSFDGFADWVGSVDSESEIWRSKTKNVGYLVKTIYPTSEIVSKIIKSLSSPEASLLQEKAEQAVNKLGLFKGDKYYEANLEDMPRKIIFEEEEAKRWNELCTLDPSLRGLHLILFNVKEFKDNEPEAYHEFIETLERKKDPKQRADKVIFSYEVHDGEIPIKKSVGEGAESGY